MTALEVAAIELLDIMMAGPTSHDAPPSTRVMFLTREAVRKVLVTKVFVEQRSTGTVNAASDQTVNGYASTSSDEIAAACKQVVPVTSAVIASLHQVVDPNLEELRSAIGGILRDRCADAVRDLRASSAKTPSWWSQHILDDQIGAALAEAQRQLLGVCEAAVRQRLSEDPNAANAATLPAALVTRLCERSVAARCARACTTTHDELTARLAMAAAPSDSASTPSDDAEAVGRAAAAAEARGRLRGAHLTRDAHELRNALAEARRALSDFAHGDKLLTAMIELADGSTGSGMLSLDAVAAMSDEERLAAALAASLKIANTPTASPTASSGSPSPSTTATAAIATSGGDTAAETSAGPRWAAAELNADDLVGATSGFDASHTLGAGSFGTVYAVPEGRLPSVGHGGQLAVKRLDSDSMQGIIELQNEIDLLSLCRHEHLLPLLGFCLDKRARCLVYPLMVGGNLEDAIMRTPGSPAAAMAPLDWRVRLRVLRGVCRALLYLHTPCGRKGEVLHRDIKPANILLDEQHNAKLADVGLATHKPPSGESHTDSPNRGSTVHASRNLKGTIGYLDPLYVQTGMFTHHADAYAMGVTMLVCLTGKSAQDAMRNSADLLEDPSTAPAQADATAKWPAMGERGNVTMRLAELIVGLVCGGLRRRMPFEKVVTRLEELAEDANLRPGVSDADVPQMPLRARECVICMAAPRNVRFACGHLTCCTDCTNSLLATENQRLPQNMCPTCRARIVVIGSGPELAFEATFIQQPGPPPPPVEIVMDAAPRRYPPGHEIRASFDPGPIGAFLESRGDGVVIHHVEASSQADEKGLPAGAEIVQVNGQSARGMTLEQIAPLAAVRPFSLLVRVPIGESRPAVPLRESRPAVPLRAPPPTAAFVVDLGLGPSAAVAGATPATPDAVANTPESAARASRSGRRASSPGRPRRASSPRRQRSASPLRRLLGLRESAETPDRDPMPSRGRSNQRST